MESGSSVCASTALPGTLGSARVAEAAFLASLEPFLLKTDDNPEGVDGSPHGLLWTHAQEVTDALLAFLAK